MAFLVGAFAPLVLGWAKSSIGLTAALASLSLAYLCGGILLFIATRTSFKKDYYDETREIAPESA
jgi:hypothetical protein